MTVPAQPSAQTGRQPTVVPPVDTLVVEHANTTGTLPFGDQNTEWESGNTAGTDR